MHRVPPSPDIVCTQSCRRFKPNEDDWHITQSGPAHEWLDGIARKESADTGKRDSPAEGTNLY